MKNILLIVCSLILCTSCDKEALQMLKRADGMMNSNCDSALTLLSQIDCSELYSNSSRAYYALLLTEARYKNFIPLGNDSLISIATEYYSRNNDSHLYGRALMYRGCALFEAMDYNGAIMEYKKAEQEFEKDANYTMLGLINTRLGEIYEKTFASDSISVKRYKKAAAYFHKCGDSLRISGSYQQVGQMFMLVHQIDSAAIYLEKAIDYMPAKFRRSNVYVHYLLMKALIYGNNLDHARRIGLSLKDLNSPDVNNALAEIYIKEKQQDSALVIFNDYKNSWTELSKLIFLKKYHKSLGNFEEALFYEEAGNKYADSIEDIRSKENLSLVEHRFDYTQNKLAAYKAQSVANKRLVILLLMIIACLCATFALIYVYVRKKKEQLEYIDFIEQLKQEKEIIINNASLLAAENNKEKGELYELLGRRFSDIQSLLDLSYQHLDNPSTFVSKVKKELSSGRNIDAILDDLYKMADRKHHGALSAIKADYTFLSDTDLKIISLYSENFSAVAIAFLFNTTPQNIYTRKYRLSKKLNITGTIEEFVQKYPHIKDL